MARTLTTLERQNQDWFKNDHSVQSLREIRIEEGAVRGLSGVVLPIDYPIIAIAGQNGSGKSTLLALAACAFHNHPDGWALPGRKSTYYTFSDFFIQTGDEVPLSGIRIGYGISSDQWVPSANLPDGRGIGNQIRKKEHGGKWNDYAERVRRPVAFLGIERVVPPSERSVFKSYRYHFSDQSKAGWQGEVRELVSRVLLAEYDEYELHTHSKYRLPVVRKGGTRYSGFNMGAGEKALFEVFSAIASAPRGTLFLIDEIELGLHVRAQRRFIEELSQICVTRHHQVICTTHSPEVLSALPPIGRFLIERGDKGSALVREVTPAYAAGRMSGIGSDELTVYVEDSAASRVLESLLPFRLRARIRIVPVGCHGAVVDQLAATYRDDKLAPAVGLLDGDQRTSLPQHQKKLLGAIGGRQVQGASEWASKALAALPGSEPPEVWALKLVDASSDDQLLRRLNPSDLQPFRDAVKQALARGEHAQVYTLSESLHLPVDAIWQDICRLLPAIADAEDQNALICFLDSMLQQGALR